MEASRHQRAALLALAGFVGGAGVAAVYARGIRRAIEGARLRPARASQYSRETLRPSAGASPQTPANGGHEEVARRFQVVSKCQYISSVLLSKCKYICLRMPAYMCWHDCQHIDF
jgi:hypothetical protein